MSIYSLVYVSIASEEMGDNALKALLKKSRENNAIANITGMLLYRDGLFIQALEGEQHSVTELFEKIREDKRHYNVLVIYEETIENRNFGQWTMGFATPDLDELKQIEGFTYFMQQPPLGEFGKVALKMGSEVKLFLEKFRS